MGIMRHQQLIFFFPFTIPNIDGVSSLECIPNEGEKVVVSSSPYYLVEDIAERKMIQKANMLQVSFLFMITIKFPN